MALVAKTAAPVKTTVVKSFIPAKTTVAPPPPTAAPNYTTLMAQASTQASKLASAQIAAQIQTITDQQDALRANASAQAQQINDASLAAAQFLGNLGDKAQADYGAAVSSLSGMTGGFTGALRDSAQQAADAAQAQLAGIAGNTQQIQNRGPDLANLLYGVSGYIPANALAVQGLGATEAARAIPAQTIGYGQSQASGTLATGNKAADDLNAQIATIRATLPSTTSSYLNQFQTAAQNQVTNARNASSDYYSRLSTLSQIDARTTAATNAAAAAKRAGRALTLKEQAAQPHFDIRQSRDGIMRDQYGTTMTSAPDTNGTKHYLLLPGYRWGAGGQPVAPAKPTTQYQRAQLALQYTNTNHYKSDSQGNPILGPPDASGHRSLQPVGNYVINPADPTGHSVMLQAKPGKPFVPKPINVGGNYGYVGQDGQIHNFTQADGTTTIPFPVKPSSPKLVNSGGYWSALNADGTLSKVVDESGQQVIAGTPKTPPAVHYGKPYVGSNGNWFQTNPQTGKPEDTGVKAPAKLPTIHYGKPYAGTNGNWWQTDPTTGKPFDTYIKAPASALAGGTWSTFTDRNGVVWRLNSKTNQRIRTSLPGRKPGGGAATVPGSGGLTPSGYRVQMNRIDDKLQGWVKQAQTQYTYDFGQSPPWIPKPGGAIDTQVQMSDGSTLTIPGNAPPPLDYNQAKTWVLTNAPKGPRGLKDALARLNAAYPIGFAGHTYLGKVATTRAAAGAAAAFKAGLTYQEALKAATGKYPQDVLVAALNKVYRSNAPPTVSSGGPLGVTATVRP
jgi:hypothetical protein